MPNTLYIFVYNNQASVLAKAPRTLVVEIAAQMSGIKTITLKEGNQVVQSIFQNQATAMAPGSSISVQDAIRQMCDNIVSQYRQNLHSMVDSIQ